MLGMSARPMPTARSVRNYLQTNFFAASFEILKSETIGHLKQTALNFAGGSA
jgi:hypothetical protein